MKNPEFYILTAAIVRFIAYRLEEICGKPIRDIRPGAVVPDVIANGNPGIIV